MSSTWDCYRGPPSRRGKSPIATGSTSSRTRARTEDIAACEKAGLTPYVPRPQRGSSASNGFFRKDEFHYDTERDAYACPGGHELKPFRFGKLREMTKIDYANKEACGDRPLRPRCTDAGYRAVSRLEHEDALDRMAVRLKDGNSRPPPRDGRTPVRQHKAMDVPGR